VCVCVCVVWCVCVCVLCGVCVCGVCVCEIQYNSHYPHIHCNKLITFLIKTKMHLKVE